MKKIKKKNLNEIKSIVKIIKILYLKKKKNIVKKIKK